MPTTAAEGVCPKEASLLDQQPRGTDSESRSAAGPGGRQGSRHYSTCHCTKESQLSLTGLGNWPSRVISAERLQVKLLPKKLRKHLIQSSPSAAEMCHNGLCLKHAPGTGTGRGLAPRGCSGPRCSAAAQATSSLRPPGFSRHWSHRSVSETEGKYPNLTHYYTVFKFKSLKTESFAAIF